jgi:glycosyltransferase involved in cell wall biosynthesis
VTADGRPSREPRRHAPGTVLFVGNFTHPPDRVSVLLLAREIMPAVKAHHDPARLRIVGIGPPREVLDLAGPDVDVIADVPSVRPHLEAACVVLAPVRTRGGMRMKVLHALASGKAVVTTTRGAEGYGNDPPFAGTTARRPGRRLEAIYEEARDGQPEEARG